VSGEEWALQILCIGGPWRQKGWDPLVYGRYYTTRGHILLYICLD